MNRIKSFTINHNLLMPGFYISREDGDVITYDLRTRKPNAGDYMDNATMHSLEHMFATYIRNSRMGNEVVYFGPMGCQTGFYLLVRNSRSPKEVFAMTKEVLRQIYDHKGEVFGKSAIECGHYENLSLAAAKAEAATILLCWKNRQIWILHIRNKTDCRRKRYMRIGVIGAMQIEVDNLKASMSDISTKEYSGVTYVCGTIGDKEVVAAVCGIGKVFAAICAEAMILEFHVDYVINIGVGGTLCKELGVMDVAVADKVVQHDMNTTPLGDPVGLLSGINEVYLPTDEKMCRLLGSCLAEKGIHYHVGTIATGDLFVSTPEQKTKIHERFDAIACEMEGGSIGHVCYVNKVPFAILRSISDGEGASMDYATFAEKAALQSILVVIDFIQRADELQA